jgi:hypothetical protein
MSPSPSVLIKSIAEIWSATTKLQPRQIEELTRRRLFLSLAVACHETTNCLAYEDIGRRFVMMIAGVIDCALAGGDRIKNRQSRSIFGGK